MNIINKTFTKSMIRLMKHYKLEGKNKEGINAAELCSLIEQRSDVKITHSYVRRILRSDEDENGVVNLSFAAADAIAKGLNTNVIDMLSLTVKSSTETGKEFSAINIDTFTKAQKEAESTALDVNIDDPDFVKMATAYYYNGLISNDEKTANREVMKLIKDFS